AEKPDNRHGRLLSTHRERPGRHCTTDETYELAPPHSRRPEAPTPIDSNLRQCSGGGRSRFGAMSALGQKQTYAAHNAMSALPPIATAKADIRKQSCLLYPQKRTCAVHSAMSALGQKRTSEQL